MSPSAIAAAKQRQQAQARLQRPGSIIIDGTTYQGGGLHLGPYRDELNESGNWKPAQRMVIRIPKSKMATPPAKKKQYSCDGKNWKVDEVAGQSPDCLDWIIKGIRWPDSPS